MFDTCLWCIWMWLNDEVFNNRIIGFNRKRAVVMGHGVGPYLGLNEIGSPSPIMTFITINYLFNFIFGFIQ